VSESEVPIFVIIMFISSGSNNIAGVTSSKDKVAPSTYLIN
jgi:hypothetical protein